ncbi:unnamed protein product [Blepharisma stoltei]|uniref:Phosphoglycolate phosphatase n=1 Tax=Blepharisma stoltei TaxID=1481888 RepID=A0AAU9J0M3_9CILI|nr:unnamed protein product [Blepharisma stoltei]
MILTELHRFDYFFFDIDGVVFENFKELPGSVELISRLQRMGKEVYFISNNCELSRTKFKEIFESIGIFPKLENLIVGAFNLALWVKTNCQANSKVLTLGPKGVDEELSELGFQVIPANSLYASNVDYSHISVDNEIKIVAVSDTGDLNYHDIAYASRCVQLGAQIATSNYDCNWRLGRFMLPCSACTVDALLASSGAKNFINAGKPNPIVLKNVIERDNLDISKIIVFGDTMKNDILLTKICNVSSALVLTGVEDSESYLQYSYRPDFVFNNLLEILT